MKKNVSFYLKPQTLNLITNLKIEKGFDSNAQVIEF